MGPSWAGARGSCFCFFFSLKYYLLLASNFVPTDKLKVFFAILLVVLVCLLGCSVEPNAD